MCQRFLRNYLSNSFQFWHIDGLTTGVGLKGRISVSLWTLPVYRPKTDLIMSVKRQSVKTRWLSRSWSKSFSRSQESISSENYIRLIIQEFKSNVIESASSSSAINDHLYIHIRRAYPISSSQIADLSHAGPVTIQPTMIHENHHFNSDCDTEILENIYPISDDLVPAVSIQLKTLCVFTMNSFWAKQGIL